ncbi:MAG: oligopeptide transporter, OPT family [Planctomycetes bacterium]|nr:oligopeptide transporter, OPT family [Planctomycetota bacterium]
MSAPTQGSQTAGPEVTNAGAAEHQPYVADEVVLPEFTWGPLLVGAVLGIIFGASSLYLLLKVGMTVSASVPIAVLSITLFRAFSKWFKIRQATILENNIVQTAGSAGESLAFGVGVTMPALLLIGFEMHWVNVMTVAVLGGLLGILLMIPLRRAFIVKQHGKLKYPEGTACAEVLIAGEKGGASARMVFIGFGIAFVHKLLTKGLRLWSDEPTQNLYTGEGTEKVGLKGAAISGELAPEMLGVGYLIGPRIACMMMAGAVISFFIIGPLIATFGERLDQPVPPAVSKIDEETGKDVGLIRNMDPDEIYRKYLRYIGAGAVAAGGIISMLRAMPLIISSIVAGVRDLRSSGAGGATSTARTERDLPITVVFFGSLALVIVLALVPQLGLGFTLQGILGAVMILLFGFLFVTVSSRLTGEVGSSSNPISGMTIATLLLTCLIFVLVGKTSKSDPTVMLTALSVAAVVCIASSNGGTMLLLNAGGTHYTKKGFNQAQLKKADIPADAPHERPGKPYDRGELLDEKEYRVVHLLEENPYKVSPGRYLVDDDGKLVYRTDVPIKRESKVMDNGEEASERFKAPQPELFALIIKGILGGNLEWALVITGVLIAVSLELMGVSALPVAVGMYLGLSTAMPIFIGGLVRWLTDRWRGVSASEAETETSPGVLLSSGYIAGGTLCGLIIGFVAMVPGALNVVNVGRFFGESLDPSLTKIPEQTQAYMGSPAAKLIAVALFLILATILFRIGTQKEPIAEGGPSPGDLPNSGTEYPRQATGDERPPV